MKYSIQGFNQKALIEHKLGLEHVEILRWFIDFRGTKKMTSIIIDNEQYFWVKYDALIETLPILGLKKDTIYRKFKDLVNCKVLKHYTSRDGGVFSYYTTDGNYDKLIYSDNFKSSNRPKHEWPDKNPVGMDKNPAFLPDKIPEQNNSSIKRYSSITNNNKQDHFLKNENTIIKVADNFVANNKPKDKSNYSLTFDYTGFDDKDRVAINSWFDYREVIKKKYKNQVSITMLRNRMLELKQQRMLTDTINHSIAMEYTGLFSPGNIKKYNNKPSFNEVHDFTLNKPVNQVGFL